MSQDKAGITLTFEISRDGEEVRTESLSQDIIKLGKLASSHLRIEDDKVSRMHAVIEVASAKEIVIIDLGSASGTFVNGQKINKSALTQGDEIKVGDTTLRLSVAASTLDGAEAQGEAPAAPPVAPGPPIPQAPVLQPPVVPQASVPQPPGMAPAAAGIGVNPFAPPVAASPRAEDGAQVSYGIIASGPAVSADEVETSDRAVEVVVMWGETSVLHVEHLSPPRAWYVGEPAGGKDVGFLIGADALGGERRPIVVESGAHVAAVIPPNSKGYVTVADERMTFDELRSAGKLQPCAEWPGAEQYPLPDGATVRAESHGFTFITKSVQAGRKVVGGFGEAVFPLVGLLAYLGGVAAVAVLFLVIMYFQPPGGMGLNVDSLDMDNRLVEYVMEPEEEEEPEFLNDNSGGSDEGQAAAEEDGQMGDEDFPEKTKNAYGVKGPQDNPNPQLAREQAREEARTAGILGVLAQASGFDGPTSPFGADSALGNDPMSALGHMMGDQIGGNFGFGGLGMRGTGRGGGGVGQGTIGSGALGTLGRAGGGDGTYGRNSGNDNLRRRSSGVPRVRLSGNANVRGSLSKDVIRRIIRRHINEVRFCYEQALNSSPDLEGRVTVAFIISPTGAVQSSTVAGSSLGNQAVEGCIASAVRRWGFPQPDGGGIVVVNYPFMLSPSGG